LSVGDEFFLIFLIPEGVQNPAAGVRQTDMNWQLGEVAAAHSQH
jgi:hypothetical protein